MSAILFGSISTVADTSELQREAFNQAFAAHGLDWHWSRADYLALLEHSGGEQRIADQARERGVQVDAVAVHATKSERFRQLLGASPLRPRDGVVQTIRDAQAEGFGVAFVTTTSGANVQALPHGRSVTRSIWIGSAGASFGPLAFTKGEAHAPGFRHGWAPGDVVMWDNACVLHRADHSDVDGDRTMHRGMVAALA